MVVEAFYGNCPFCVLRRDFKSRNVMLDADLGDFSGDHCKLNTRGLTVSCVVLGLRCTGRAVKASGIYVFGISVLEVVCGRRLLNLQAVEPAGFVLLDSVWRAHEGEDVARDGSEAV